jgi:hypothetical protein
MNIRISFLLLVSYFLTCFLDTTNAFSSFVSDSPRMMNPALGANIFRPQQRLFVPASSHSTKSSSLSMHMGHSHSHNHAVQHGSSSSAISTSSSSSSTTKPVNAGKRRVALFLFSALAILGPPLVRKGRLAQPDVIAFALTSTTLALVETTIRREIKHVLTRIRQLGHGIRKHSTPLDTKFFFQNDNAADRVTLVGGIINVVLSVGKFAVGVACHSSALVADAGHSLSDLFSDFITLWVSVYIYMYMYGALYESVSYSFLSR